MSQTVQVQCQYCNQIYPIEFLQEHINQCQNRLLIISLDQEHVNEIPCDRCGIFVSANSYSNHTQNQCVENQLDRCNYCYINFPSYLMVDHLRECQIKQQRQRQQRMEQQRRDQYRRDQQRIYRRRLQEQARERFFPIIKRIRGNDSNAFEQLIFKQQASATGQTCTICQQEIEISQIIANIECQHVFHYDCLKEWGKQRFSCPSCRRQLKSTKKEIKIEEKKKIMFIKRPPQLQKKQFQESAIFHLLQSKKCLFKKLQTSKKNQTLNQQQQIIKQPEIKMEILGKREEQNPEIENQIQQKRENIQLIQRETKEQKKEQPPVIVSPENQELQFQYVLKQQK